MKSLCQQKPFRVTVTDNAEDSAKKVARTNVEKSRPKMARVKPFGWSGVRRCGDCPLCHVTRQISIRWAHGPRRQGEGGRKLAFDTLTIRCKALTEWAQSPSRAGRCTCYVSCRNPSWHIQRCCSSSGWQRRQEALRRPHLAPPCQGDVTENRNKKLPDRQRVWPPIMTESARMGRRRFLPPAFFRLVVRYIAMSLMLMCDGVRSWHAGQRQRNKCMTREAHPWTAAKRTDHVQLVLVARGNFTLPETVPVQSLVHALP